MVSDRTTPLEAHIPDTYWFQSREKNSGKGEHKMFIQRAWNAKSGNPQGPMLMSVSRKEGEKWQSPFHTATIMQVMLSE